MSDAPVITPPAPSEPPAAAATPPMPTPPITPPPVKAADPAPDADSGDDTPNVIKALRDDFKAERAKRQAAEESARNAVAEMTNNIGKALGLVKDEPLVDPVVLTKSLTDAQADAKKARVDLAVFKAAGGAGGDPIQLLDSESFKRSLDDIDPDDNAAITAAISAAVEANPRLGAAMDPRMPAPNPAQGSSASGAVVPDIERQIADASKAGDIQLVIALKQQRAAQLATGK